MTIATFPHTSLGAAAAAVVDRLARVTRPGVEILTPETREEWLALRTQTIGASEIAAVLGCHPWETPFSLWAKKTGATPREDESPAMKRGRYMERVALDLLREERPDWIVKDNPMPGGDFYRDLARGVSCTPDAFVRAADKGRGVAQVKSVQKIVFDRKWKNDDGDIEPPLYVAVQAMQEAALTGADFAVVVALVVDFGIDLHVFDIPLHPGVLGRIERETAAFWDLIRRGEQPPPDFGRDGELITRLYADDDGATVDLSGNQRIVELIAQREALKEREADGAAAAKERKTIDAEIIFALGNAARGRLADGRIVEAKTVRRNGYEVAPSSYRSVRIKRAKASC
jgi:putative phage-type endonuclease